MELSCLGKKQKHVNKARLKVKITKYVMYNIVCVLTIGCTVKSFGRLVWYNTNRNGDICSKDSNVHVN